MKQCAVIAIVHDINSLRGLDNTLEKDIELLNQFDVITLPSKLAREVLTNAGLKVPVVIQKDPFDFLTNTPINYPTFSHTVNYAGNISFTKAGFLGNINDVYMHIFGSNLDFTLPKSLEYMGQFDNDKLISKLNTGYGLLWDSDGTGNTTFKTYEKYNWQYKLSLYLASGIIPIADTNSNVGTWLKNNNCGLTLGILEELDSTIIAISKSQYEQLQDNIRIQQHRLREGYYTKELISRIEYELNKIF
ncbi:galactofuranosyltransferase [Lactiplantibacillus plantarum]|nr:galactofuranosyltransferase [Lactiplantibacillus plantarum]